MFREDLQPIYSHVQTCVQQGNEAVYTSRFVFRIYIHKSAWCHMHSFSALLNASLQYTSMQFLAEHRSACRFCSCTQLQFLTECKSTCTQACSSSLNTGLHVGSVHVHSFSSSLNASLRVNKFSSSLNASLRVNKFSSSLNTSLHVAIYTASVPH